MHLAFTVFGELKVSSEEKMVNENIISWFCCQYNHLYQVLMYHFKEKMAFQKRLNSSFPDATDRASKR